MAIDKKAMKLECRLTAIEHLLVRLWADRLLAFPDPIGTAETMRRTYLDKLETEAFAGTDPAQSDLAAAEVQEAFDRVLTQIRDEVAELAEGSQS